MVFLSEVLGAALRGKSVTVTLKSGLQLTGTLKAMDGEHLNLVLDHATAAVRRVTKAPDGIVAVATDGAPPHLACVTTLQVRGSAVRSLDFDPATVSMDLMVRALAMD